MFTFIWTSLVCAAQRSIHLSNTCNLKHSAKKSSFLIEISVQKEKQDTENYFANLSFYFAKIQIPSAVLRSCKSVLPKQKKESLLQMRINQRWLLVSQQNTWILGWLLKEQKFGSTQTHLDVWVAKSNSTFDCDQRHSDKILASRMQMIIFSWADTHNDWSISLGDMQHQTYFGTLCMWSCVFALRWRCTWTSWGMCSDITNTLVGISGETVPEGWNPCIYWVQWWHLVVMVLNSQLVCHTTLLPHQGVLASTANFKYSKYFYNN